MSILGIQFTKYIVSYFDKVYNGFLRDHGSNSDFTSKKDRNSSSRCCPYPFRLVKSLSAKEAPTTEESLLDQTDIDMKRTAIASFV